jgi:hypothetical protein
MTKRQGAKMRVSDDRYSRDRLRLDLALRFIHHEARTRTIRAWTGLTDDRIRKLYRSYFAHPARTVVRPRGKSPQQAAYFTRSPRVQQETALLASLCSLLGVLPQTREALRPAARTGVEPGVALGERVCQAFEVYRMIVPAARISFEHLMLLLAALKRGDELKLSVCGTCGALLVVERLAARDTRCLCCAADSP